MGGRRPRQKKATRTETVTVPAAILIGSALIGAGLYFGLRARADGVPSARTPVASATTPERVPVTTPSELYERVEDALEAHRETLLERCWRPAVAAQPEPPIARFTFNYTFAPDGRELGRGVEEDRATGRPELTACVLRELPPLKIAPIGRRMTTKIALELP